MAMTSIRKHFDGLVVAIVGLIVLRMAQGSFGFYDGEGINLVKAQLVADGHSLYDEIYSDQAPMFTWILSVPMLFGIADPVLSFIPVLFGTATLLASKTLATRLSGRLAGWITAGILLCLAPFLKFSGTLVINTPALALGTWAVVLAVRHTGERPNLDSAASGLLVGTALTVKLATVYFAPVTLLALALHPHASSAVKRVRLCSIHIIATLAPGVIVASFLPLGTLVDQLLAPHTTGLEQFDAETAVTRKAMLLAPGAVWMYLAAVAGGAALLRRSRIAVVMIAWLLIVSFWMAFHRPLWLHHHPDFLVPLVITGAAGAIALLSPLPRRAVFRALAAIPGLVLVTGILVHSTSRAYWEGMYDDASEESLRKVAEALSENASPEDWVLTDRPILAYWANRKPPPWFALILRKRLASGGLDDRAMRWSLIRYRPSAVALCKGRLNSFPSFQEVLSRDYVLVSRMDLTRAFTNTLDGRCRLLRRRGIDGPEGESPPMGGSRS